MRHFGGKCAPTYICMLHTRAHCTCTLYALHANTHTVHTHAHFSHNTLTRILNRHAHYNLPTYMYAHCTHKQYMYTILTPHTHTHIHTHTHTTHTLTQHTHSHNTHTHTQHTHTRHADEQGYAYMSVLYLLASLAQYIAGTA